MAKFLFLLSIIIWTAETSSQTHSDSANEAYQKYLGQELHELLLSAITDSIYSDGKVEFEDYSVTGISDSVFSLTTKNGVYLLLPLNYSGWILRSFRKSNKDGFWIFIQYENVLIERWNKGVLRSRRWILRKL